MLRRKTCEKPRKKGDFSKVKERRKENSRIDKLILKSLESGPKTIPQIARETRLADDVVTYNLMTLRKYGKLETGEIDDMDEYFSYQLKQKKEA